MRQEIISVLTEEEKQTTVLASLRLLSTLEKFEGTNMLMSSLRKLLVQIFEKEPEHYVEEHIDTPLKAYHDYAVYCSAYKIIGTCKYFASGKVTYDLYSTIMLPAWEPKDEDIVKTIAENTKRFRQQFQTRFEQDTAEAQADKDIKHKDKEFWKTLQQHKYCFMKYQICKFLKRKFKAPKRFMIGSKTLWQFVDLLRQIKLQKKDTSCIDEHIQKAYMAMSNLFQIIGPRCYAINLFESTDNISTAVKEKSLCKASDNSLYLSGDRLWSQLYIKTKQDPRVKNIGDLSRERKLIDWFYTLQDMSREGTINSELKEFLELLGIIQKEESDK